MKELIEAFFSVFSEFTWRRCIALLVFFVILIFAAAFYESYTSSFRLSRLQHSAELLLKIHEMETSVTNASPEVQKASGILVSQAVSAVETKPISIEFLPSTLKFSANYLWKYLAGAAWWWLLAISKLPKVARGDKESLLNARICFYVGIGAGLLGIAIPPLWWPWFHLFIYPFCLMGFFLLFVALPFMFWWCSPMKGVPQNEVDKTINIPKPSETKP